MLMSTLTKREKQYKIKYVILNYSRKKNIRDMPEINFQLIIFNTNSLTIYMFGFGIHVLVKIKK